MSKYHLFSTSEKTKSLGWCYREVLPLRVEAEGFKWETAERVSPYRVSGKGWEAVEDGHLTADELTEKNRHGKAAEERKRIEAEARMRAKEAAKRGRHGGHNAVMLYATDKRTGDTHVFGSIREAERVLGLNKTSIRKYAMSGGSFGGYVFRLEGNGVTA